MLANKQAGFTKIKDLGLKLTKEIKEVARKNNKHKVICQGVNSMFQIFFTDQEKYLIIEISVEVLIVLNFVTFR